MTAVESAADCDMKYLGQVAYRVAYRVRLHLVPSSGSSNIHQKSNTLVQP